MDLLNDDHDERSQPAQQSTSENAGTSSVVTTSRHGGHTDVLASLVRATTDYRTEEDSRLLDHICQCSAKPCSYPNCEAAKEKLKHYYSCQDPKCFVCVLARLTAARDNGDASRALQDKLILSRSELQEGLKNVKKKIEKAQEVKKSGDDSTYTTCMSQVQVLKQNYNKAKEAYENICEEVSNAWLINKSYHFSRVFVPGLGLPNPQISIEAPPPPPSSEGVIASTSINNKTLPKRLEELDGNSVEYILGDSSVEMTSILENECEQITSSIVQAHDDDWFKYHIFDEKEPNWTFYNILTRSEIDEAEQRCSKRLYRSGREHEYLSRACQEIIEDVLNEAVELSISRNTPDKKRTICLKDLRYIIQSKPKYARLLRASELDSAVANPYE